VTAALTVMMPVFNARPYLKDAVDSILSQTLADIRLLIIDDGSDDGSGELLQDLEKSDPRIDLIRRGRKGQIETRNELLNRAQTDIVACADADDISHPTRLADQLAIMRLDVDLVALGSQLHVMDEQGCTFRELRRPTGAAHVRAALLRGTAISQPSCVLRRSAILSIGGYRKCYEHAEDYDMFLRASEAGKVDNADFFGIRYRVHAQSVSHRHAVRQMASADLARATHQLRIAGQIDPTASLQDAPEFDLPMMRELVPSASLYAALESLQKYPDSGPLLELVTAPIDRRQARHVQRALVEAVRHRPFDALSARALLRAASLGPGRLARSIYARQRGARTGVRQRKSPLAAAG
jgi:hypothetical protein